MRKRPIEKIVLSRNFTWIGDGFCMTSFVGEDIPKERMSPFFAVNYAPDRHFEPRDIPCGVGAHPHKGFETVTIPYKGKIENKDTYGNHGVIDEGDVQWMTAGAGVIHKEHHEESFSQKGGLFQMVQMWINLPAKEKETQPKYQNLLLKDMTKVQLGSEGSFVNVIAGEYEGQEGKGKTFSPIHLYNVYLNKGTQASFTFPEDYNTAILVVEGGVNVNGNMEVKKDRFAMFENDNGDTFTLDAMADKAVVLIMSGEPLNEPIAYFGPFVMNTQEQLLQAIRSFDFGKFGAL